jgi:hypothetical protein
LGGSAEILGGSFIYRWAMPHDNHIQLNNRTGHHHECAVS